MAGKSWRMPICILAAVAAAKAASAQTSTDSNANTSAGTAEQMILDTISVTATRNPIKAFEYPGMVTVTGREAIRTLQPSSVDDVLRFVPGVEFTGGPRRTGETPTVRGFDGADVVILLDGARQNFGSAHDGRFFIDPSLLKQVEVLRGPASALYGSGGTGGVIEFRTIDAADFLAPGETAGLSLSGGYQSVNRERVGTVTGYGTPIDGLDLVGSLTKRDSGSIELGDGTKLTSTDDDIISGLAKASYRFGAFHRIEGSFLRFDNDAEEPNNGQGLGDNGLVDKDIETDTFRAAYSYKNPDDNLLDLDLVAYYTDFQADELRLDDGGIGPTGELLKRDVDTLGFRVDNRSRFMLSDRIGTTFTYGGEYYTDEQDGAAGAGERDGVPDADADTFGLFAQAEIAIAQPLGVLPGDLLLIPGIRFDSYESSSSVAATNDEEQVSPRFGVSYLPTDFLLLFANYAEAFRAPTFDELFLTGTHFRIPAGPGVVNRFVSNPDLDPQRTRTVEVGAGLTFNGVARAGDLLQIKGSYYRTKGKDFIDQVVTQPDPFNPLECTLGIPGDCDGTTTTLNVPEARLFGTEIEASYESNRYLLSLGYSKLDGENDDTGEKLGTLTPTQLTLNAALKLPEFDSIVGWRLIAAKEFEEVNDPDDARDGYGVNDIYAAWAPSDGPLQGFRLDVGIDNVFDKKYTRVNTNAVEAGRNYKAFVSYAFKW